MAEVVLQSPSSSELPTLFQHLQLQQISLPPELPAILKRYAKAAIRTQPTDLLVWSAAYFKALSIGIPPPVKERIEYPTTSITSGLTPGFLKVLINQVGRDEGKVVPKSTIIERWTDICLSEISLEEIFNVGGFHKDTVAWLKFVAICAGYLESRLSRTMVLLIELLSTESGEKIPTIPIKKFLMLYRYLAIIDCGPVDQRRSTTGDVSSLATEASPFTEVPSNLRPIEEAIIVCPLQESEMENEILEDLIVLPALEENDEERNANNDSNTEQAIKKKSEVDNEIDVEIEKRDEEISEQSPDISKSAPLIDTQIESSEESDTDDSKSLSLKRVATEVMELESINSNANIVKRNGDCFDEITENKKITDIELDEEENDAEETKPTENEGIGENQDGKMEANNDPEVSEKQFVRVNILGSSKNEKEEDKECLKAEGTREFIPTNIQKNVELCGEKEEIRLQGGVIELGQISQTAEQLGGDEENIVEDVDKDKDKIGKGVEEEEIEKCYFKIDREKGGDNVEKKERIEDKEEIRKGDEEQEKKGDSEVGNASYVGELEKEEDGKEEKVKFCDEVGKKEDDDKAVKEKVGNEDEKEKGEDKAENDELTARQEKEIACDEKTKVQDEDEVQKEIIEYEKEKVDGEVEEKGDSEIESENSNRELEKEKGYVEVGDENSGGDLDNEKEKGRMDEKEDGEEEEENNIGELEKGNEEKEEKGESEMGNDNGDGELEKEVDYENNEELGKEKGSDEIEKEKVGDEEVKEKGNSEMGVRKTDDNEPVKQLDGKKEQDEEKEQSREEIEEETSDEDEGKLKNEVEKGINENMKISAHSNEWQTAQEEDNGKDMENKKDFKSDKEQERDQKDILEVPGEEYGKHDDIMEDEEITSTKEDKGENIYAKAKKAAKQNLGEEEGICEHSNVEEEKILNQEKKNNNKEGEYHIQSEGEEEIQEKEEGEVNLDGNVKEDNEDAEKDKEVEDSQNISDNKQFELGNNRDVSEEGNVKELDSGKGIAEQNEQDDKNMAELTEKNKAEKKTDENSENSTIEIEEDVEVIKKEIAGKDLLNEENNEEDYEMQEGKIGKETELEESIDENEHEELEKKDVDRPTSTDIVKELSRINSFSEEVTESVLKAEGTDEFENTNEERSNLETVQNEIFINETGVEFITSDKSIDKLCTGIESECNEEVSSYEKGITEKIQNEIINVETAERSNVSMEQSNTEVPNQEGIFSSREATVNEIDRYDQNRNGKEGVTKVNAESNGATESGAKDRDFIKIDDDSSSKKNNNCFEEKQANEVKEQNAEESHDIISRDSDSVEKNSEVNNLKDSKYVTNSNSTDDVEGTPGKGSILEENIGEEEMVTNRFQKSQNKKDSNEIYDSYKKNGKKADINNEASNKNNVESPEIFEDLKKEGNTSSEEPEDTSEDADVVAAEEIIKNQNLEILQPKDEELEDGKDLQKISKHLVLAESRGAGTLDELLEMVEDFKGINQIEEENDNAEKPLDKRVNDETGRQGTTEEDVQSRSEHLKSDSSAKSGRSRFASVVKSGAEWSTLPVYYTHVPGIGPPVPEERIIRVEKYLTEVSGRQAGYIMTSNLRHYLCPSLDP